MLFAWLRALLRLLTASVSFLRRLLILHNLYLDHLPFLPIHEPGLHHTIRIEMVYIKAGALIKLSYIAITQTCHSWPLGDRGSGRYSVILPRYTSITVRERLLKLYLPLLSAVGVYKGGNSRIFQVP